MADDKKNIPEQLRAPKWMSLSLRKFPGLKRNRCSHPLPVKTIPLQHIPARWWILLLPVTRRPRRRKMSPNLAEADRGQSAPRKNAPDRGVTSDR